MNMDMDMDKALTDGLHFQKEFLSQLKENWSVQNKR